MPDERIASIADHSAALRSLKISSVELTRAALERAHRLNPELNCLITTLDDRALAAAWKADREIKEGRYRGPLHGIPYTAKDIFATEGVRTTVGSKILSDWIPERDAAVIARLNEAGAILVGKTNLSEFAAGPTNSNVHFGPARNPWHVNHITGGSSGGSAAAVAARIGVFSLGTDTGGSVRMPAALCGTFGIKPTFGRVSCEGVVPLAWSLDTVGVLSRSAVDADIVLDIIADPGHRETAPPKRDLRGTRVGLLRELLEEPCHDDVRKCFDQAIHLLADAGAYVEELSWPGAQNALAVSSIISWAETTAAHSRWFPAFAEHYGPHLRNQLIMGQAISARDYLEAAQVRRRIGEEAQAMYRRVNVIALPSVSVPAPRIGQDAIEIAGDIVPTLTAMRRFARLASCTGQPAISIPCGLSADGLPIGLQLIGRAFGEKELLDVAAAFESISPWPMLPTTVCDLVRLS